jgi:NAD(P)-dependent dehydrogenase (short-subunit alcohol dehydrogenase family)
MNANTIPGEGVCFVAVSGTDAGAALAGGLARKGAEVALLTDTVAEIPAAVFRVETSFSSRESVAAAFAKAQQQLGTPQMIVHSAIPATALISVPIHSLSYEQWSEITHAAVKSTFYCLQAAYDHFDGRGGSIVVFGPVFSLVGAPGLVALSTVLEAQRALVKSAARQWGQKGIRVNWVAIGSESNYPALAAAAIPQVIELGPPPPPLGRVPSLASDAAALIGLLGCEAASVITGATLNIDGGNWMVP